MPINGNILRAFPELSRWQQDNHSAMEQWRERTNLVLNRASTEDKTTVESSIKKLQEQIDALNAQFP